MNSRDLLILDYVPVGAVIGKGGSYCKALRQNYGVRCDVAALDRKVTLKGSRFGIERAVDDLAELFETFAIAKDRVFEILAKDGPTHLWSFLEDEDASSDAQIEKYPYRLQQSGQAVETASRTESWIKEFREDDTAEVMAYLAENPSEFPVDIRVAFGKTCFKLRSRHCKNATLAWPELQRLRNYDDFSTRWSNFCTRATRSMSDLMDDLEEWMEEDVEPRKLIVMQVADADRNSYEVKYHLVNGQWELHSIYQRRHVRGSYDVILNNEISFRMRASTRTKLSKDDWTDIERHLELSLPDNGDIFATKVSLRQTAPVGMSIKSTLAKSTVHLNTYGLRFNISYVDQCQKEFRLECRLPKAERKLLDDKDNEAQVLLEKVLKVLA
uniref:K Homology domain-containing protein n=1 Tax=Peronospora matthiolae TaxID=2874970 RepID=A0AAV1UJH8_9STRA